MTLLMVILGAAVGAPMRYLGDLAVQQRMHNRGRGGSVFGRMALGTLVVNVVACLILGVLTGAVLAGVAPHRVQALIGIGFCGTLSTYSTFSYETLRLAELRLRAPAVLNVLLSVGCGLGAAFAGAGIADAIW